MLKPEIKIVAAAWQELAADAMLIREQVFIQEQNIAPEDEWDADDASAQHFVLYQAGQPVATARLLAAHSIGRVAVLKQVRGLGLGFMLMQHIIQVAREQQRPLVCLSAQTHALSFYANLGFKPEGAAYLECGIPHQAMRLKF